MILESIVGPAGAFAAAWLGASLGFRRSKKERSLDRQIEWHKATLETLSEYEEALERLHAFSRHSVIEQALAKDAAAGSEPRGKNTELPQTFRPGAERWRNLGDIERRSRAQLRLADVFVNEEIGFGCQRALSSAVDVVASNWMDASPDPAVRWLELHGKSQQCANLRRLLQDNLRQILEVDGLFAVLLGERYRRWHRLRQLERLKKKLQAT